MRVDAMKGTIQLALLLLCLPATSDEQTRPSVASINLCADQLLLTVAEPNQVLTVSWLAADPEESMLAAQAQRYPLNYGSAEELLQFAPDVVVAGAYTSAPTRQLLTKLGYRIITIEPATTVADIERNLRLVGAGIRRGGEAERVIAAMRLELQSFAHESTPVPAIVVRPGGFTVGPGSLADQLLGTAGLRNVAAEQALDRWGSLSIETLLRNAPKLLIVTAYRSRQASLANTFLEHPALRRMPASRVVLPARYWSCGIPASLKSVRLLQHAAQSLPQ